MVPLSKEKIEEFFAKLSAQERLLVVVAAVMVFCALTDRVLTGPLLDKLKDIDQNISAQKEMIKRDRRIISFHDRILSEYDTYRTYLDSEDLTQEEIVSALLKKIETLAKDHQITVKNIQPGDMEEKPLHRIYKTAIDSEGTLVNMLAFMTSLEESDSLFQIPRYTMAPKSKGADVVKCTMDISRMLITSEKIAGESEEEPGVMPPPEIGENADDQDVAPDASFAEDPSETLDAFYPGFDAAVESPDPS